jgi:hypothetical protein
MFHLRAAHTVGSAVLDHALWQHETARMWPQYGELKPQLLPLTEENSEDPNLWQSLFRLERTITQALSPRKHGFDARYVHLEFEANRVALEVVFSRCTSGFPCLSYSTIELHTFFRLSQTLYQLTDVVPTHSQTLYQLTDVVPTHSQTLYQLTDAVPTHSQTLYQLIDAVPTHRRCTTHSQTLYQLTDAVSTHRRCTNSLTDAVPTHRRCTNSLTDVVPTHRRCTNSQTLYQLTDVVPTHSQTLYQLTDVVPTHSQTLYQLTEVVPTHHRRCTGSPTLYQLSSWQRLWHTESKPLCWTKPLKFCLQVIFPSGNFATREKQASSLIYAKHYLSYGLESRQSQFYSLLGSRIVLSPPHSSGTCGPAMCLINERRWLVLRGIFGGGMGRRRGGKTKWWLTPSRA